MSLRAVGAISADRPEGDLSTLNNNGGATPPSNIFWPKSITTRKLHLCHSCRQSMGQRNGHSVRALLPVCLLSSVLSLSAAAQASDPERRGREITCEQMTKSPHEAFAEGVDLGSGHSSPTAVDYDCAGGLQTLPFLDTVAALTNEIRSEGVPTVCTGTIVYAQRRHYRFDLLKWGLAPALALDQYLRYARDFASIGPRPDTWEYLEAWSYDSYSNFALYHRYRQEIDSVRPLLVRHYTSMGHAESRAGEFADHALATYVNRAAGAFPSDSIPEIRRTLQQVAALRAAGSADQYLKTLATPEELRTALNRSLLLGKPRDFIEPLLDKVQDLDAQPESPLVYAMGDRKLVEAVLRRDADVNHQNAFGKTPLFYAIERDDLNMVKLLLEHGADVNHAYNSDNNTEDRCAYPARPGRTPLMHAAQHAGVNVLKLLLQAGASRNAQDSEAQNAADYAALSQKEENVAYLKSRDVVGRL